MIKSQIITLLNFVTHSIIFILVPHMCILLKIKYLTNLHLSQWNHAHVFSDLLYLWKLCPWCNHDVVHVWTTRLWANQGHQCKVWHCVHIPWSCSFYWYVLYLICFIVTLFTYTIQLIFIIFILFLLIIFFLSILLIFSPTRPSSLFMLLYHFFLFYIPVSFLRVAYRKICLACDLSAPVMKGYWSSWAPSHLRMYMKLIVVEKKFIFFGGMLTNKIFLLL